MADHTDDHLFDEIEEDLRAERYAKLWKQYGKYVIALLAAVIIGVAGYQGWRSYDLKSRTEQSDKFAAAIKLLESKQTSKATEAFASLAKDGSKGYQLLARLQQAAILSQKGDKLGAKKIYEGIVNDAGLSQLYRDLALMMSVLTEIDTGDPKNLRARLSPLVTNENPWRHSAKEISAILTYRAGERKKAYDQLNSLSKDATAPQGVRTRAAEMAAAIAP